MGVTISEFLKPSIPSLPQGKQESILQSKDFHWVAFGNALLISGAGVVFITLLVLQVLVLGISSSSDLFSAGWRAVLLSFIISTITFRLLQILKDFENTATAASQFKHDEVYPGHSSILNNIILETATFIFFTGMMISIDHILSTTDTAPLWVLITHGHVLEFFLVLFIYILLAGTVGGAISALALIYYDVYPLLLGAHIWFRKVALVLRVKMSTRPLTLDKILESRCPQCSATRAEIGPKEDDRRIFFCELCGYRFPGSEAHQDY